MTDDQRRYIAWFCDHSREVMRICGMGRCTCISSTKIAYLCLTKMGIEARPLACKYVCSWEEKLLCHAVGVTEDLNEARLKNPTLNAVPLSADWQPANGWDGHLVLVTPDGLLIDPNVDESL